MNLSIRSKCNNHHFYRQQMQLPLLAALFDRAFLFRSVQTRQRLDFLLGCDNNM